MAATNADRPSDTDYSDFTHTGPGTLAGRYLRRFWQPVYRATDLAPGWAKPVRILGEDFTLYRGEGGTPHLVAYRCAHRGTQLSTGWVEGDCIRCFYHGWKYDGSGQCVEMPAEDASFPPKVRIASYPTEEYLGLIFAYLGEGAARAPGGGAAPALSRFPELEDQVQGVREVYTYTWPCNYFQALENDPFHGDWVHRQSYLDAGRVGTPQVSCEETEYGYVTHVTRPEATKWPEAHLHFHMPNATHATRTAPELGQDAWREAIAWRVPVDDEHLVSYGVNLTHVMGEARTRYEERQRARAERVEKLTPVTELGEAVLRGEFRIEDIPDGRADAGRLFNLQDYVSQVGQGTITDRQRERLGRADLSVIMLRNLWRRELRALMEGRPLKQWARPERRLTVGRVAR
jgi:5,5'-dehydrodivanillate O-demethylase oxygenase subunit